MILLFILYRAEWGAGNLVDGIGSFLEWRSFIPAILIGVPLNEGIHGLTWLWMGKIPKEKIKFGMRHLTPYTHIEIPIPARIYRVGAIMPVILQGLLP